MTNVTSEQGLEIGDGDRQWEVVSQQVNND